MPSIRPARPADIPDITAIYNEAIRNTTATFDTEEKDVDERKAWLAAHDHRHPVLVAVQDDAVVGWASLTPWSDRCAYADTAELSLYVHHEWRGRGIGKELMRAILAAGRDCGLHTVLTRIVADNAVSIHLHEAFGFTHVGVLQEVGRKFGRLLDVVMMQLIYRP